MIVSRIRRKLNHILKGNWLTRVNSHAIQEVNSTPWYSEKRWNSPSRALRKKKKKKMSLSCYQIFRLYPELPLEVKLRPIRLHFQILLSHVRLRFSIERNALKITAVQQWNGLFWKVERLSWEAFGRRLNACGLHISCGPICATRALSSQLIFLTYFSQSEAKGNNHI